jgi:ParB family chromosome partitioning protein
LGYGFVECGDVRRRIVVCFFGVEFNMRIKLISVRENPFRLRDVVKDEAFHELADSLREKGLLHPIKVRPHNNGYEIVYGHRRVAAMRELGWETCEAIVEDMDDGQVVLQAVAENIHRSDLTPMEEAQIYGSLQEQGYTSDQIAEMVNKAEWHIDGRLRLLRLPPEVQKMVRAGNSASVPTTAYGTISVDSASRLSVAVASPDEAIQVARKAVEERLTSREIRELAAQLEQTETQDERRRVIETPFISLATVSPRPEIAESSPGRTGAFHTADRPISEQFHAKWIWNLSRLNLGPFSHFTIGYSQRNWDQVRELLQIAQVTMLVDARRNAISQYRPEFSKSSLQSAVEMAGIIYRHVPELGIPVEERQGLSETHDYGSLFHDYDQMLNSGLLEDTIGGELRVERIAFLCVEIDPNTCHRHRIALLLEEMGYSTLDL